MKRYLMEATSPGYGRERLKTRIRNDRSREMAYRRAIVATSLVGMASMAFVTLFQTGAVRRLPDPPTRRPNFDTATVNTSDEAYSYGMPDGPLTLAMHAANLSLAAAGPPERWRERPWIPVAASAFSGAQAAVAAQYLFWRMPFVDRAWCPYCVVDALAHFASFGLSLPETAKALGLADGRGAPPSRRRRSPRPAPLRAGSDPARPRLDR
ncbi:vitamin K epoxide reductase family protein [Salinarimonas chemoclinalis]|uniref:vitamin K epoxide reductase family protein n=1 Tax=Salinarimonas chemoclinalis TaxID=3241599 RepID=UPI003555FEC7